MQDPDTFPSLPSYNEDGSISLSCRINGVGLSFERFELRDNMTLLKTTGEVDGSLTKPSSFPLKPVNCHMGIVIKGALSVSAVGSSEVAKELLPGDWFIYASSPHELIISTQASFNLFTIESGLDGLHEFFKQADPSKRWLEWVASRIEADKPTFATGHGSAQLIRLSTQVIQQSAGNLAQRLRMESMALSWLCELLAQPEVGDDHSCAQNCPTGDDMAVLSAARYIEANLHEDHSTAQLSRRFHLNEFKLKKGFREVLGNSIQGYLRERRMEHAAKLLSRGELSVMEVANQVGYENASHFARGFKRHHGVLPKRYQLNRLR
ncbi:MAG: AraC family transcriptional regulator [Verrucomicrobiota bacterium]